MIGVDRRTGQPLSGQAHLRQSIEDILSTPVGSRRMRPEYGSQMRRYVDLPVNEGWKKRGTGRGCSCPRALGAPFEA
nr:hypothetical protein GCM10020185_05020 [Pseudomonas brassicacearum subsp. brassicacearum]